MDNGVKFKYTHYNTNIPETTKTMCSEDLEVPCSHPSAVCRSQLTSRERRARTAKLRREFKQRLQTAQRFERVPSCPPALRSQLDVKFPEISNSRSRQESRLSHSGSQTDRPSRMKAQNDDVDNIAKSPELVKKPMQLEDFIRRHPSGMGIRPNFVFNLELKRVPSPVKAVHPDHRKTFFQNYRKGRPRFHFIDPDWFSERETFKKNQDDDRMKYSWM